MGRQLPTFDRKPSPAAERSVSIERDGCLKLEIPGDGKEVDLARDP